ncbi:hypothetical protein KSX_41900 [Ktedonospora formicarum]|uniref:Uncharacterized protein n=1 Tax=Ktedonospora formicarum TaxID=2778364 RepID=A0A8J3I4H1_9CHLR|nr:hypothetical protein KSX_41900 [Ktedonospora formicarum]
MHRSLGLQWAFSQGMWTMQATSPFDYAQKMAQYTMEGADKVVCPILVCDAENDHFFTGQPMFENLSAIHC